ncbi:MAG: fibronectin type III domain-containing protein [Deltaproteobacteria bacterium]|nr:fibronectin type III domain-containing protein [Deltaproteobacteria bacterium]
MWYVGYSYWRNINNHENSNTMLIFLSLDRSRGGMGPTLFSYNKVTDQVENLGALFDSSSVFSWHSGNGWYFSGTQPTKLYVYNDSRQLYRYDVITKQFETVLDIGPQFGTDKYIYQMHSSDNDRVHAGTLRSTANWEMLGCFAYQEDTKRFFWFPKIGVFDECNLDKSGRWLLVRDGPASEDNRIIDLQTGTQTTILDQQGGLGHLDMGDGYAVGADNYNPMPNSTIIVKFPVAGTTRPVGPVVHHNSNWNTVAANHVSHQNRKSGVPPEQQYACGSNLDSVTSRENEIVCFRLDSSYDVLVVAPVMTNMNASGGGDSYSKMPKGNLDVTGRYFIWTSNMGGSRLDAFIAKVPADLLVSTTSLPTPSADTTPPVISGVNVPVITSSAATIMWSTNESSDTQVEYGPTTAYGGLSALNTTKVTSHSATLSGVAASTLYHYRVKSRDASGNLSVSGDFTFTTLALTTASPAGPSVANVVWTNLVNVTATGNSLKKTSGCNGCADAGATSQQTIASGNGYVEFTAAETSTLRFLGLSNGNAGTTGGEIKFAIRLQSGWAEVRESGVYKKNTTFATGDVFRIAVESGAVKYYKNGGLLYTSTVAPTYPLLVDTSIYNLNGTLSNAVISTAATQTTGTTPAITPSSPTTTATTPATTGTTAAAQPTTSDSTPPLISSIFRRSGTGTTATITWRTNEPADSQLEYGTTKSFGTSTPLDRSLVTSHALTITGLKPNTWYYIRVKSRDAAGNLRVAENYAFRTLWR